jgi:hypothetical protein
MPVVCVLSGAITLVPVNAGAEEPLDDAQSVFTTLSEHLGAWQNIEPTFDSAIEVITTELEKIQFTGSGRAPVGRQDTLRAHRVGGLADALEVTVGSKRPAMGPQEMVP